MTERKPDGGLSEWIETLEAMGGDDDGEMLCLLLELRRFREDKPALIEQLEAAQRERDEWIEKSRANTLLYAAMKTRAELAEAELKRRDEQEPVATKLVYSSVLPNFIGDTDEVESYSCFIHGNTPPRKTMEEAYADAKEICGPIYAAAPAAVPERVVKLPVKFNLKLAGDARTKAYFSGNNSALESLIKALDAAGVKYEVSK